MSPALAGNKISQFDTENNIKCGITNRGDFDFGTFRHEKLQYIYDIAVRCGLENPLPGFRPIPSGCSTLERFGVDYVANMGADISEESLTAALAAGGPSAAEAPPSTDPGDDDAGLDDIGEALQVAGLLPFLVDDVADLAEGAANAVSSIDSVSAMPGGSAAVATPVPPATLPSSPLLAALHSSTQLPAPSQNASRPAEVAAPALPFSPPSSSPPPAAQPARPVSAASQSAARAPSFSLPASLQAVRLSSSLGPRLSSSVGASVQSVGAGTHHRSSSSSPYELALAALNGTPLRTGGQPLTITDMQRPVRTRAEKEYFFASTMKYQKGGSLDFDAFNGAWNREALGRMTSATRIDSDLESQFHFTNAGLLRDFWNEAAKARLMVDAEVNALTEPAAADVASGADAIPPTSKRRADMRVDARERARARTTSAAAAAAAAAAGSVPSSSQVLNPSTPAATYVHPYGPYFQSPYGLASSPVFPPGFSVSPHQQPQHALHAFDPSRFMPLNLQMLALLQPQPPPAPHPPPAAPPPPEHQQPGSGPGRGGLGIKRTCSKCRFPLAGSREKGDVHSTILVPGTGYCVDKNGNRLVELPT